MTTHEVTHPSKRRCFTEGCTNEPGGKWFCRACKGRIHEASVAATAREGQRRQARQLAQQARARGLPLCVAADSPDIPVGPPDAADAAVGDVAPPPGFRFFRRVDARNSAPEFGLRTER
jgi:hypothetical protein